MKEINRENIRDFFLTNRFLRKSRIFFYETILPILIKVLVALLTALILAFITLKFFKPSYLEKMYQKASFHFFQYLDLDNHEFSQINIEGNKRIKKEEIIAIINSTKGQTTFNGNSDYQPLIHNLVDELKSGLPWINKVVITRTMPNILNISIVEYEPFAIWQNEGKKYIIDKGGNTIPFEDLEEFKHFVIVSGKGANIHAKSLFNIFVIDPALSANVYSATWVGNRRWDIRFENGLLIKLSESNISDAWQRLIKIYNMPGSIVGLKMVDLRVIDKVYLEYEDSMMKELKNL